MEQLSVGEKNRFEAKSSFIKPKKISEIEVSESHRLKTGISELDNLLGGGLVAGSLTLIAGEPGIGKSTLVLQLSNALAKTKKVLYVCGEESLEQTTLRAKRLKIESENLYLLNETLFSQVKIEIDNLKPDVVIVDSVQILYKSEIPSSPGSVVQVREIATEFMHLAKGSGITVFLIGHVTKSGEIAGPRVLEHLVDTVLEFEGDRQMGFRLLRSIKNRFGPTDDIVLFNMKETGLEQILNPSSAFLQQRVKEIAGSTIVPTVEGAKAILIEIQALVTNSVFPNPSRRCTGVDQNRLALLLAVLEKRVGYKLYNFDVFVSVAGGLKILEPAADLGIVIALASSFSNHIVKSDIAIIGEVGLGGEIRSVTRIESRIKEAINMGFHECIVPEKNLKDIAKNLYQKINILGVNMVNEAINKLI